MLLSSKQREKNISTTIPLSDIRSNPTERYCLREKIGQGGYGYVYKAIDTKTGEIVAAKLINLDEAGDELESVQQEIQVLSTSTCNQLTKYYASYLSGSQLWIVMEYLEAGSLLDLMNETSPPILDEESIAYVMRELLFALAYLHAERKIHRDIKASNILVSGSGAIKLADFGVTGQLTESVNKRQTRIGTPYWMAPEVITESSYDSLADIWSVGITCLELSHGKPPYATTHHPMQTIFLIPKNPPPVLEGEFSENFKDFVSCCLQKDPNDRKTASTLLKHPFLTNAPPTTSPPTYLLQLIQQRIDRLNSFDEIDALLDYGSRSNSYSNSRLSHRKSADSGGWDFNVLTLKKNASQHSYDEYGYGLENTGSLKPTMRRDLSYNSLKSVKSNNSNNGSSSCNNTSNIHQHQIQIQHQLKNQSTSNSSTPNQFHINSSSSSHHSNTNSFNRKQLQIRSALMRTESDLTDSADFDNGCKESKYITTPSSTSESLELTVDGNTDDDDLKQDSKAIQSPTPQITCETMRAFQTLQKILEKNSKFQLSDLFQGVFEPTLNELEKAADEMRGDSEATRKETMLMIHLLKNVLIALDKHTDGFLTSSLISTIIGFGLEDEQDNEEA